MSFPFDAGVKDFSQQENISHQKEPEMPVSRHICYSPYN